MRFVLHCYVCEGGKLHFVHNLGSCTLGRLLDARPVHCRYAVVQAPLYAQHAHHWPDELPVNSVSGIWVIDMYLVVPDDFSTLTIGRPDLYPDLDTAIAATILRNT